MRISCKLTNQKIIGCFYTKNSSNSLSFCFSFIAKWMTLDFWLLYIVQVAYGRSGCWTSCIAGASGTSGAFVDACRISGAFADACGTSGIVFCQNSKP